MCFLAAVCESCFSERLEEERRSQLDYVRAAIFVRQVGPGSNESLIRNILGSGSTAEASIEQEDPDYQVFKKKNKASVESLQFETHSAAAAAATVIEPNKVNRLKTLFLIDNIWTFRE